MKIPLQEDQKRLSKESMRLARLLMKQKLRIVFAESCTAGLATASLAEVPGISSSLCGSFVVYRDESKSKWLGIPLKTVKKNGAVSELVTETLVKNALKRTPEADIAAAITGHLGPGAPASQDGQLFISVLFRKQNIVWTQEFHVLPQRKKFRRGAPAQSASSLKLRKQRQVLASHAVLFMVRSLLEFKNFEHRSKLKPRR